MSSFQNLLLQLFMQTKFTVPVIPIQIDDKNFLSYIRQSTAETRKIFITDFDGIFEKKGTDPLYRIFFRHLAVENKKINLYKIDSLIARIYAGENPNSVFTEITDYLSSPEVDLQESEYLEACRKASDEWQPNKEAFNTIGKLRERGYRTVIISGSAFETLAAAAEKVNFEPYQIFSTTFSFGSDGKLKRIYSMLGENKAKKIKQLFGEQQIEVSATDDLKNDYYIIEGAELAIIVSAKDPNSKQYTKRAYVFDENVRDNFSLILDYVDKFEYSYVRSKLTSEAEEESIVEYVVAMKKALKEERKFDFLKFLKLLNTSLKSFNLFARDEQLIAEYEIAVKNESESEKRLFDEIVSTLQRLPEYVNTEVFVKELRFDGN